MTFIQCEKGHFYDSSTNTTCPACGVDIDLGETRAGPGIAAPGPQVRTDALRSAEAPPTQAAGGIGRRVQRPDEPTRAVWTKRLGGIDPVVGWLVCIDGPDKGRDYRLHTERNFIGRDAGMDVVIAGDSSVSRENHAVVSYNPKRHTYNVAPGASRGITYLNDEELLGPQPLKPYDQIEVGGSKLLFVPFCGEQFHWPMADTEGAAPAP